MTFICKWCVLSLNISFWVQCSKSLQSILLPFLHPVFPIKLNSICPHSHIHELLAPQPPLHLPSVSFFLLVSSSLSTGGELPRRWSSTRAGKLPHRGATARSASRRAPPPRPPPRRQICRPSSPLEGGGVTRHPPQTVSNSKLPWRWWRWCGTVGDDAEACWVDGRWTPASLIPRCEGWSHVFLIRSTLIPFYFLHTY
jgi:hypothetical protein